MSDIVGLSENETDPRKQNFAIRQLLERIPSLSGLSGIRLAETTNYTVAQADNGKTIALGGAAFYSLTFSTPSGYTAPFKVKVVNEDTVRGKAIVVSGGTNFILYPGQFCCLENQNNVWEVEKAPRWRPPSGATIDLYADFTNGSDTVGTNDGLASGNAFKTVQHALGVVLTDIDFYGSEAGQTSVVVHMAASTTDTNGVHFSAHGGGGVGAQGGFAITVQGAGSSSVMAPAAASAFEFYFGVKILLKDLAVASGTSDGVAAHFGAHVYIDNVYFGACGNAHKNSQTGGHIENAAKDWITGNAAYHCLAQLHGRYRDLGFTHEWTGNTTFTTFVTAQTEGLALFTGTMTVGAFTILGQRYNAQYGGRLFSATGVPNTYFPGNSAGSVVPDGFAY